VKVERKSDKQRNTTTTRPTSRQHQPTTSTEIQDERRQPRSFKTPNAATCGRVKRETQHTSDATSAQTARVRQAGASRHTTRGRMTIPRPQERKNARSDTSTTRGRKCEVRRANARTATPVTSETRSSESVSDEWNLKRTGSNTPTMTAQGTRQRTHQEND
jgi:hypothetical protein